MQVLDLTALSLTFNEEFDTFLNSPNGGTGTWMTSYPYSGWAARTLSGNNEAEYYSDTSVGVDPFTLVDGVLGITARPAAPGSAPPGLSYTSGIITTDTSFSQTYGYFEARAQLPAGRGLWPAFWMLPASNIYTAELDVFEVLGHEPHVIHSSVHGGYADGWATDIRANVAADTSDGFHTYGVDWGPETTSFYLDGVWLSTAATPDSMNTPMFMLLNVAVGNIGSWPGAPDGGTAFPATMRIDHVRAYATAHTRDVSGAAALMSSATLGQGADTLVLFVAGDAWQGDPRFTVAVDGHQIGGTQTVAAAHAAGAAQAFTFKGDFAAGRHGVKVSFINDAYGGPVNADRNLFVTGATLNGVALPDATVALFNNGSGGFSFAGAASEPPADPPPGPTTIGAGPDTLTLRMSEDAWRGDAQFTVSIDGRQIGGVQTVTASHAAGLEQVFDVRGDFGAGSHAVLVSFLNDAYGGTSDTDRNLFVAGAAFNGVALTGAALALTSGAGSFSFTQATPAVPDPVRLRLQAYDWRSHALLAGVSVSLDGGGTAFSTGADGTATVDVTPGSYVVTATRSAADAGRAITAADALAALRIAVGLNPNAPPDAGGQIAAPQVSPYQLLAADVNGDGRVTAADALAILRMAVKLPGAPAPRWIFVDEANSTWDPVALNFVSTRSSVTPAASATADVTADARVGLVGVLTGAVLGRWASPGGAALPTSYFQALSQASGAPLDQWGYGAAISASTVAAVIGDAAPVFGVAIHDTAANIAAGLDRLEAWHAAGLLTALTFMETTAPVLAISIAQFANARGALSAASGVFRLDIGAGANAASASLSGAGVMTILGPQDIVAARTGAGRTGAATIHYTLTPGAGVETIADFRYGIDRLDIDLAGHAAADLLATDVVLGGAPAIALGVAVDPAHVVVLTGAVGTAAMLSLHLTFADGHALIT